MSQHEGHSPWWPLVTSVTFEKYPSEAEVRAAETQAIKAERPAYNIAIPGARRRYNDLTPRPRRAVQSNCQPGAADSKCEPRGDHHDRSDRHTGKPAAGPASGD